MPQAIPAHGPNSELTILNMAAVSRSPAWWLAAILIGLAYILILGRGIVFRH